ncbi:MAG: right-handed parallel beta-helix repeat-containing protein [Flavobacteriales bacterium]|nr:right-handed parallel beta-helix repeat-containing protein [Flavobacteriales bacterium]MBK7101082.1 right-handed parallel beta-helix repeat-containing protein [Flavobacteriales bacterium]MBK7111799.1 right-handed parallel beta-helix repeat-containing protein [Flavobacteriales bacterium]MBP8878959.1 right-handed parallel beta-helix repeat-containing protein [Flavobacteriales bacterium]
MRRSSKPRKLGFWPWVIGILLVGGGLVALFSLTATERMAKDWPLGIDLHEVRAYATVLDRRPVTVGHTQARIFRFGGAKEDAACLDEQPGGSWRTRWFETEGYGDSVEVRHLRDRVGFDIRFKKAALLDGQRRSTLTPAHILDIRAMYLEAVAAQLGVLTPSLSYVRLIGCGRELGVYRRQERVGGRFLERRGLRHASLVTVGLDPDRPDAQFATVKGDSAERAFLRGTLERAYVEASHGNTEPLADLVDQESAIAWLLMAWIDGRDLRGPIDLVHQWSNGRMAVIYEVAEEQHTEWNGPVAYNPITPLLARPEFRARFEVRAAELVAEIPALRQQFDGLRKAWLPVLSDERTMPFAQTVATRSGEDLLYRIASGPLPAEMERASFFAPGHASFLSGMPIPAAQRSRIEDPLTELVQRLDLDQQGDTIFFPRGKYRIDQDLRFPTGTCVVLLQGARLFMAPGVNMRCYGELHIRGTIRNPVFIRPQEDGSPFGTIAVIGSGSERCSIRGLYISGGSSALLDGIRHDAMVSVQGVGGVQLINTVFEECHGPAGLAIHGGEVELDGVRFEDAPHTMLALSNTEGQVRNGRFVGRGTKGAALRVEGGKLAITGCMFVLQAGVGVRAEATSKVLVYGSNFNECAVAISATEGSIVHVAGNVFKKNALVLEGSGGAQDRGAQYLLYPNEFMENAVDRKIDSHSKVGMKDTMDPTVFRTFGMPEREEVARSTQGRRSRN